MTGKQMKCVTGEIKRITEITSRDCVAKTGKNAGKPFNAYSIGVLMDDGNWYNVKGTNQAKVEEIPAPFKAGMNVSLFLEPEDEAGKYWRIVSITNNDKSAPLIVHEEETISDEELDSQIEELAPKTIMGKPSTATIHASGNVAPLHPHPQTATAPTQKNIDAAKTFADKDANKYLFGMACNNAAIIFASIIQASKIESKDKEPLDIFKEVEDFVKDNGAYYEYLVKALFKSTINLRKELLENAQ